MAFCYSDTPEPFTGSLSRLDPNKCYMKHFGNYLYLKFIFDNSDQFQEKAQANKEILIAEKKMAYWAKNQEFDMAIVAPLKAAESRKWNR